MKKHVCAAVCAVLLSAPSSHAALITFETMFDGVTVDGAFETDDSNLGGLITKDDVLGFNFRFLVGSDQFEIDSEAGGLAQTINLTLTANLHAIATWDISIGQSVGNLQFAGNNTSGDGFAEFEGTGNHFVEPAPQITSTVLVSTVIPLPATLPLLFGAMAGLCFVGRMRGRRAVLAWSHIRDY